jgi:hypothetical protein
MEEETGTVEEFIKKLPHIAGAFLFDHHISMPAR